MKCNDKLQANTQANDGILVDSEKCEASPKKLVFATEHGGKKVLVVFREIIIFRL